MLEFTLFSNCKISVGVPFTILRLFAVSEHGVYEDQLCLLQPENFLPEFNCLAVSSSDNPDYFDGHRGHRSVALFWRVKFNDFITPIQIDSDRNVGIKFSPSKENTFHYYQFIYPPQVTR